MVKPLAVRVRPEFRSPPPMQSQAWWPVSGQGPGPVTLANQGGTVSKAKEQNIEGDT